MSLRLHLQRSSVRLSATRSHTVVLAHHRTFVRYMSFIERPRRRDVYWIDEPSPCRITTTPPMVGISQRGDTTLLQ